MNRARIVRAGLLFMFVSCFLSSLFSAPLTNRTYAFDDTQVIATWVDAATVKVEVINATKSDGGLQIPLTGAGGIFFDNNVYDDTANYKNTAQSSGCQSELYISPRSPDIGTLRLRISNPATGRCPEQAETITLKSVPNANIWFEWMSQNQIRGLSTTGYERNATFTLNDITKTFLSSYEDDGCRDYITVNADKISGVFTQYDKNRGEVDCENKDPVNHAVGIGKFTENGAIPPDQGVNPTDTADGANQVDSCESLGGVMSWITCPLINIADNATSFLDNQIISLLQVPRSDYTNDTLKSTWESVRNVALIILIPIMLVMVISTALGFSFVDAYTIKKALPRFVVAVMFIVLSWWITIFLLDLTNDVGKGILGLMTNAFGGPDALTLRSLFDPNVGQGVATGAAAIAAAGGAGIFLFLLAAGGGIGVILSFAGTTLLALFLGFLVLTIRQMLLVALTLFAPLAILAWIFPGNDKLWKIWWETFSKLLLMFPIIMIIIASGRIFAGVIGTTGGTLMNTLLKLVAYIAPYFFIPATFKIAGGLFATLSGVVNDRGKGMFDRGKKYRKHAGGQAWERTGGRRILQARAEMSRSLQSTASRSGRFKGALLRGAAGAAGGYNVEAAASARQGQVAKELNDQIATGRDDAIRGLTVDRKAINATNTATRKKNAQGQWEWDKDPKAAGILARVDGETGERTYKSIGGAWINEASVMEGHDRWGKDHFAQQTALSYEMRKAITNDQVSGIAGRYQGLAKDQWNMTDTEAGGAWIGSAFENQNQHLEFKSTNWENGQLNGAKFAEEVYERKGTYPLSQMNAHTIDQLRMAYDDAVRNRDTKTQEQVAAVAETFMNRGGAQSTIVGMNEETPMTAPAGAPGARYGEVFQTNGQGAAHVNEAIRDLAIHTGVYRPDLPTPRTTSDQPYINPATNLPSGPARPGPTNQRQN